MNIIVFIVGVLFSLIGLSFIFVPSYAKNFLKKYLDKKWMVWAVVIRLGIGALFILSSNNTRYPYLIFWLGIVMLLSGISLPIIGREKVKKIINWWLYKPIFVLIISALAILILGLFIIYSANI